MSDIEKLGVLLPHWVEHNAEHVNSFRTWAERARAAGEEHLAVHIEAAAQKVEAANRDLEVAIEHLGEAVGAPLDDHPH
jgi:endo-1,4-beta-mannosidase